MTPTTFTLILLTTLISILYLLDIGLIVTKSSLKERGISLLVTYAGFSFLWTLPQLLLQFEQFALPAGDDRDRLLLYGILALAFLFFHLSRSFLRLEGGARGWWGLAAVWLVVAIFFGENALNLPDILWAGSGWLIQREMVSQAIMMLGWLAAVGSALYLTIRSYYGIQQPLHRNRITYWFVAMGLIIIGGALFFSGYTIVGNVAHLLGVMAASGAMLIYRLPDVRQMGRQTISYLIITTITMVIYSIGILASQAVSRSELGLTPFLVVGLVALALAIIFDPLLRLIHRMVNQIISGVGYDANLALREYSATISNILDLDRLATVVLTLITEAVGIRHGALFIVRRESGNPGPAQDGETELYNQQQNTAGAFYLQGVLAIGSEVSSEMPLATGILSAKNPVAKHLRGKRQPLAQYDIDLAPRFRDLAPAERDWLDSLKMDIYVPIHAKGEWIGLLTFGPKISGDRYFEADLSLISTLADQTAVALENARLFDDLRIRNQEIEHLNEELTKANRQLARLDQAKSNFIGIASHELRTPLTHIRGYNDMLGDMLESGALTPESGLRMTQAVSKAAKRLESIVDTMFDVSKIDTETLDLNVALVSISDIVQTAADLWDDALQERKQTLVIEDLDGLPAIIADGERLTQVLSQLIQNAIKYTPDGGEIRVSSRHFNDEKMQPPQEMIELIVADTGIGIAPDDLERIFEKFYRVGSASLHSTGQTKFKGAGPGLGLTIARGVVEAHGGHICAESQGYDETNCPGSRFHVMLPVQSSRLKLAVSETFVTTPV